MSTPTLLRPERLRTMEPPFGWAPCRLLTTGRLARLSLVAKALYLALCLAADRRGLSYWGDERLCAHVGLAVAELGRARGELERCDLIAFDGRVYQLLSLPDGRNEPSGDQWSQRQRRELEVGPARRASSSPEPLVEILRRMGWAPAGRGEVGAGRDHGTE